MLLAGVMLKLGLFGLLRYVFLYSPIFVLMYGPAVIGLCVVGAVVSNVTAYKTLDLKKKIALSSVAHMNLAVASALTGTFAGYTAAVVTAVAHGLGSAGLFMLVGFAINRGHTRRDAVL